MSHFAITKAGAVTALGHDIERTVSSLRSGLDGFRELQFWGVSEQDIVAAPIKGFAEGLGGTSRYQALALEALRPCLNGLEERDLAQVVIYLGLPRPNRPGIPANLALVLKDTLSKALGIPFGSIVPVQLGHASVFWSIKAAMGLVEQNKEAICILGGVDSLVNGASLKALSEDGLIKEEWDGFIPGEAAAFVRLELDPHSGYWGRAPAKIMGVGIATETADGTAENPLVGVGIKSAFQSAMQASGLPETEIHLCINDVNGARAAFEDEAFGRIRFFRSPREHMEVWHPASFLGETGAAVGAIVLIWASAATELDFAPGTGIMASASDADLRTAVFLKNDITCSPPMGFVGAIQVGKGAPVCHEKRGSRNKPTDWDADPGLHVAGLDNLHKDLAIQNFDELAWLIAIRESHHADNEDPWEDIEEFEQRLIAHLDALAWSYDDSYDIAKEHLRSEDPDEIAAAAMILLSIPTDQTIQSLLIEASEASPNQSRAIASILPHMPRDNAEPVLQILLSNDSLEIATMALHALSVSRWINEDIVDRLMVNVKSELIAPIIEVAGAGGLYRFREQVELLLTKSTSDLYQNALFAAIAICLYNCSIPGMNASQLLENSPRGFALACLRENRPFYKMLPKERLLTTEVIDAIGWSGETRATSLLLDILKNGEDDQKSAAAGSLYRIFGCDLHEFVEVSVPDPSGDQDSEFSEDLKEVKMLTLNPSAWKEAIDCLSVSLSSSDRLRHGTIWTKQSAIDHLRRPGAAYMERLIAAWEYAIVNRTALPLHPLEFVQIQKEALYKIA